MLPNACQAVNVASSLYEHQMERSVDPKLSSAVRKVAKQKLKKWQPQLGKLTEVASGLVQMLLPCPGVPSLSSSCASDQEDAADWEEDARMEEYVSWRAGNGEGSELVRV